MFLTLPTQWIFVAVLPILVALFVGGYITKFEGFGVKLETDLKAPVSGTVELKATDALAEIPRSDKESIIHLQNMSREKVLSIKWLIFEQGRTDYSPHTIQFYLEKMSNLEFFEVRTKKGKFVCFIPVSYFKDGEENIIRRNRIDFDNEKLIRFVNALETENILDQFSNVAVSSTVKSSDSLVQVLKILRDEQVDLAAVISKSNRYIGVLFRSDVEKRVIDVVLNNQST